MNILIMRIRVLCHCQNCQPTCQLLIQCPCVEYFAGPITVDMHLMVAHLSAKVNEIFETEDGQKEYQFSQLPPAVLKAHDKS